MKRPSALILLLLLLRPLLLGQNPNTAVYPAAVATDTDLLVYQNITGTQALQTTLSSGVDAATLTIPVASEVGFQAGMIILVGTERMNVCSVTTGNLNLCAGGRGFQGTTAATHSSGALVSTKTFCDTTLSAAIADTTGLTFTVTDALGCRAPTVITIQNERFRIASISQNTFTVAAGGRGFDLSQAATHPSGSRVLNYQSAYSVNQIAAEVKALEGASSGLLFTSAFDFPSQSPAQALTASVLATVTLSPCPNGVIGATAANNHYLRITDGVGGNETVLISGGNCTSGAASGTIQFTPASSHASGDWSLGSATCGGMEAVRYASDGQAVLMNQDCATAWAGIAIQNKLIHFGGLSPTVKWTFDSTNPAAWVFRINQGGLSDPDFARFSMGNFTIVNNKTTIPVVKAEGVLRAPDFLHNFHFTGGTGGVIDQGSQNLTIRSGQIQCSGGQRGIDIDNTLSAVHKIFDVDIRCTDTGPNATHGIHLRDTTSGISAGGTILSNVRIFGTYDYGLVAENTVDGPHDFFVYADQFNFDALAQTASVMFKNVADINLSNGFMSNNGGPASAPVLLLDNTRKVILNGYTIQTGSGKADIEFVNAPIQTIIGDSYIKGTVRHFHIDSGAPPTTVQLGNTFISNYAILTNEPALLSTAMVSNAGFGGGRFLGTTRFQDEAADAGGPTIEGYKTRNGAAPSVGDSALTLQPRILSSAGSESIMGGIRFPVVNATSGSTAGSVSVDVSEGGAVQEWGTFLQNGNLRLEGTTPDAFRMTIGVPDVTASATINIPDPLGSTRSFGLTTGALNSGNCAEFDANGFIVDSGGACGGGGAALTVEEADGTPTVSSVSTIQFDQDDGFTVTDETGGQVQVDLVNAPDSAVADNITLTNITQVTTRDHDLLSGLTDDDHAQYALLAGRSTGQTIQGGTGAAENLTLDSTANATKGDVIVNASRLLVDTDGIASQGEIELLSEGTQGPDVVIRQYGSGIPGVRGKRALGTLALPTAVGADDFLLFLGGHGHDGTDFNVAGAAALIALKASETFTGSAKGAYLTLETTPDGSATRAERWRVTDAGDLVKNFSGDPADSGAVAVENADPFCWEAAPAGTDVCMSVDSSERFTFDGPVNAATGFQIGGVAASGNFLRGDGTNFVASAIQSGDVVLAGDVDGNFDANDLDELAVEAELEAVLDLPDLQGSLTLAGDVDGAHGANDLDELAVETELEAVLDLPDLQGILSVAKGGTGSAPGADDQALVSDSTSAATWRTIPDCNTNNMLTYTQATNTFGCDADDGAGGGAPVGAQYVVLALDATLSAERVFVSGQGLVQTDSGANGNLTIDLDYSDTLAANPDFSAEDCVFTNDGAGGGGFLCEGTTGSNTNEQLYLFPAVDGADTTSFIAVDATQITNLDGDGLEISAGSLQVQAADTTIGVAASGISVVEANLDLTNLVALTADTTGDYVADVTCGQGLAGCVAATEGAVEALALSADGVRLTELADDANTPLAGDFLIVETGANSVDYLTPNAGTDITVDLEEETHAAEHQDGGADEISVAGLSGLLADGQNPLAHNTTHRHGGSDEVAAVAPAANAIPKAESSGDLAEGWIPTSLAQDYTLTGVNVAREWNTVLYAPSFDFTEATTTPADDVAAGANTITITCPLGVSGTNTNHVIWLDDLDDSPADEFITLTGGTCAGDEASGTIQFTAASAHTGGDYQFRSATSGIQEAIWHGDGAEIFIPAGTHDIYALITIGDGTATKSSAGTASTVHHFTSLIGVGPGQQAVASPSATVLRWVSPSGGGSMIKLAGQIRGVRIEKLHIWGNKDGAGVTPPDTLLDVAHARRPVFRELMISDGASGSIGIDIYGESSQGLIEHVAVDNRTGSSAASNGGSGIHLGNSSTFATQFVLDDVRIWHDDREPTYYGLFLGYIDTSQFRNILSFGTLTTVNTVTCASPIQLDLAADHGLTTGDTVRIYGGGACSGGGLSIGNHTITVVDPDSFSLDGTTGSGSHSGNTFYGGPGSNLHLDCSKQNFFPGGNKFYGIAPVFSRNTVNAPTTCGTNFFMDMQRGDNEDPTIFANAVGDGVIDPAAGFMGPDVQRSDEFWSIFGKYKFISEAGDESDTSNEYAMFWNDDSRVLFGDLISESDPPLSTLHLQSAGGVSGGLTFQNSFDLFQTYFAADSDNANFIFNYSGSGGNDLVFEFDGDIQVGQGGNVSLILANQSSLLLREDATNGAQGWSLVAAADIASSFTWTGPNANPVATRCLEVTSAGQIQYAADVCGTGGGAEWTDSGAFLTPADGTTEAVSIGTASEDGKLSVYGDDTGQETVVIRTASSQTADVLVVEDEGPNPLFVVEDSGEVGIGTVNPAALLHLAYSDGQIQFFSAHETRHERDTNNLAGYIMDYRKTRAGGATSANDIIMQARGFADDSTGANTQLLSFRMIVEDPTDGSEGGQYQWHTVSAGGSLTNKMTLTAAGEFDFTGSAGAAPTAEGRLAYDTTPDIFKVGDGTNTRLVGKKMDTVTFSATPTFDTNDGNSFKITLTDNVTSSTLSNADDGEVIAFLICQDATGSRTFAWPTNVKGAGTIGAGADTCSAQAFIFDGTNAYAVGAIQTGM